MNLDQHGIECFGGLLSQLGPPQFGGQSQDTLLPMIEQVPPFWQGLGWHDWTRTSQIDPVQLTVHAQSYVEPITVHVPEFKHGFGSHGLEEDPDKRDIDKFWCIILKLNSLYY